MPKLSKSVHSWSSSRNCECFHFFFVCLDDRAANRLTLCQISFVIFIVYIVHLPFTGARLIQFLVVGLDNLCDLICCHTYLKCCMIFLIKYQHYILSRCFDFLFCWHQEFHPPILHLKNRLFSPVTPLHPVRTVKPVSEPFTSKENKSISLQV